MSVEPFDPHCFDENTEVSNDDDSVPETLYEFDIDIDHEPYAVALFKCQTRLFAKFVHRLNGVSTTKRLHSTWESPPTCESLSQKQRFYQENIASVLLNSRGPEMTPRKPPERNPPSMTSKLEGIKKELEEMELELQTLQSVKTRRPICFVLEMARLDLEEMKTQRLERAKAQSSETLSLWEQAQAEHCALKQEVENLRSKNTMLHETLVHAKRELQVAVATANLLETQSHQACARVQGLTKYAHDLKVRANVVL